MGIIPVLWVTDVRLKLCVVELETENNNENDEVEKRGNLISPRLRCNKEFDVIKKREERESKYAEIFKNKAVFTTKAAPSGPKI